MRRQAIWRNQRRCHSGQVENDLSNLLQADLVRRLLWRKYLAREGSTKSFGGRAVVNSEPVRRRQRLECEIEPVGP